MAETCCVSPLTSPRCPSHYPVVRRSLPRTRACNDNCLIPAPTGTMDDITTTRAMDQFLVNPTVTTDRYAESRSISPKASRRSHQLALNTQDADLHPSKDTLPDTLAEQLLWRAYDSDEEDLSSVDSDTMSIRSSSSGEILEVKTARLSIVSADDLARNRRISNEQSLYRAQAITIKPINYGSVCMSPRLVDIPASPHCDISQNVGCYRPPTSRLSKLDTTNVHQRSNFSPPRTSSEGDSNGSTPSTPPTSIDERSPISSSEKVIRRKSAVTGMRHAARRECSVNVDNMQDAQTLREFIASDPASFGDRPVSKMPNPLVMPSKRRLRKFSSSFSLGRFTMRNSAERVSEQLRTSSNPNRQTLPAPEVYRPTRCSSLQPVPAGKMIARGGNERAAPIVLPPCPYNSEQDFGPMRPRMQRAPKSYLPTGAPRQSGKLHRRQRSLSASDIMAATS
jgi:hypothetical protein